MPARSKTQQRLMGQAYAYKTGELKSKDMDPEYADEIKKLAKSMTEKQLRDFAKTKHKNLPEKVEEKIKRFDSFNESIEDGMNDRVVYIIIDQDMHSYEAILGIYDTFEKAMNSNVWSNRGITPNEEGEGDSLFIYKEYVNKELQPKYN